MSDPGVALPMTSRDPTLLVADEGSRARPWGVWMALAWATAATLAALYYDLWRMLSGPSQGPHVIAYIFKQLHYIVGYLLAIGMIVFAARRVGSAVANYLGLVRPRLHCIIFGVVCGLVGYFGVFWLIDLFIMYLAGPSEVANRMGHSRVPLSGMVAVAHLLWCIRTAVFAPITEELIFRGFLYRSLAASRLGGLGAVLLPALVFGIGHAVNGWFAVLYASMAGLIFGWLRWRVGSTVVCMAAHTAWNLIHVVRVTLSLFG